MVGVCLLRPSRGGHVEPEFPTPRNAVKYPNRQDVPDLAHELRHDAGLPFGFVRLEVRPTANVVQLHPVYWVLLGELAHGAKNELLDLRMALAARAARSPNAFIQDNVEKGIVGLDESTFRFNRRKSYSRGKLFYRLAQQAVAVGPVLFFVGDSG